MSCCQHLTISRHREKIDETVKSRAQKITSAAIVVHRIRVHPLENFPYDSVQEFVSATVNSCSIFQLFPIYQKLLPTPNMRSPILSAPVDLNTHHYMVAAPLAAAGKLGFESHGAVLLVPPLMSEKGEF
jgi:hypothetical protein